MTTEMVPENIQNIPSYCILASCRRLLLASIVLAVHKRLYIAILAIYIHLSIATPFIYSILMPVRAMHLSSYRQYSSDYVSGRHLPVNTGGLVCSNIFRCYFCVVGDTGDDVRLR